MHIQWEADSRKLTIDSSLGIIQIREDAITHLDEQPYYCYFVTYNEYNYRFIKDRKELSEEFPQFEKYFKLFF